jgi:hypothetical protein
MDRYKCPFHGPITVCADKRVAANEDVAVPSSSSATAVVSQPWTDKQLMNDIQQQTGQRLDYGVGEKHSTKRGTRQPSDNRLRRQRLERKLLNRSSLNRIGETLDAMQKNRNERRFQHQFTYAIPPK